MNFNDQIENYLSRLKSDPNNIEILNKIAKFYFENNDFDKALEACIKITKIVYSFKFIQQHRNAL